MTQLDERRGLGGEPGAQQISGRSMVIVNSTGSINVVLIHATTENICSALS